MQFVSLILTFILFYSSAFACDVLDLTKDRADLPAEFYDRYANVKAIKNDKQRQRAKQALIKEYKLGEAPVVQPASARTAAVQVTQYPVKFASKAKNQVRKLSQDKNAYAKYNEFLRAAQSRSFNELIAKMKKQKSWNFEQYMGKHKGTYTVRLDGGNRVRFEPRSSGGVRILEVGKNIEGH